MKFVAAIIIIGLGSNGAAARQSCEDASGGAYLAHELDNQNEAMDEAAVGRGEPLEKILKRMNARMEKDRVAVIKSFHTKCTKGEVIRIASDWSYIISQVCDLSKSVVNSGETTVCVMR